MLRMGGRSTEVAHVGGTHIPVYGWVGGASVSVDEVQRPLQPPARGHPAPDRPAAGARAGAALRPACARARGSHPARRDRLRHPAVRPGRQRRRGPAPRSPAIRPSPGTGGSFDPLLYPQPPAAGAHHRGAVRRRHPPRDRRQPAVRRGAHRGPRAQVSCATTSSRWRAERRVAETIYIPDSIIVDVPKPTAEQLNAYFEANKTKFQIPEFRAFSYVLLTADDVMAAGRRDAPSR